ncbi:MAG TPA: hypothetical protein PLS10_00805 [Chitinophagales bacterium]|nr:hypothetical protein [Chitinophagales bacterium]
MKKLIAVLFISFFISAIFAEETSYKTKIEDATLTKGSLYKQEVFSVENITAFRIDALKITNLEKFGITTGLRVVHKVFIGKELKTFTNYIDLDEIDGLITSLQYMKTILKSKTIPNSYTEIKFITKSGFQFMLFTVLNTQGKLDWSFMAQTNISNEKTIVSLSNDDVDKLQKTFEQAKAKLQ